MADLRHSRLMDALSDDDHSETIAERFARYWKNAEVAFDMASTAELHDLRHQHLQIAWRWAELAWELERKPVAVVRDGEGQRKRL
jgi:hypothetical protein